MFTRKDYMDNHCTHSQYYAQYANDCVYKLVSSSIGIERIENSCNKDGAFNDIPLGRWDALDYAMRQCINRSELTSRGETWSLMFTVCVAKEVARTIWNNRKLLDAIPMPNPED